MIRTAVDDHAGIIGEVHYIHGFGAKRTGEVVLPGIIGNACIEVYPGAVLGNRGVSFRGSFKNCLEFAMVEPNAPALRALVNFHSTMNLVNTRAFATETVLKGHAFSLSWLPGSLVSLGEVLTGGPSPEAGNWLRAPIKER